MESTITNNYTGKKLLIGCSKRVHTLEHNTRNFEFEFRHWNGRSMIGRSGLRSWRFIRIRKVGDWHDVYVDLISTVEVVSGRRRVIAAISLSKGVDWPR